MLLHYVEQGDKYLLTLKILGEKKFICKRQDVPRDYAIYGVSVDDLDDQSDVLRVLKGRLEEQVRTAGEIK